MKTIFLILSLFFVSTSAYAQELIAKKTTLPDSFFTNPDPSNIEWNKISEISVTLFPQNITSPGIFQTTVANLKVKALHNGEWLALMLEWEDATKDEYVEVDLASDACAIQFPIKEGNKTSPFMGDKEHPVSIIHWKAIWQKDKEEGPQKVVDLYPNTWVDTYQFGKDLTLEAGNPLAGQKRDIPVEELVAGGFGTLTHQPQSDSYGGGIWNNGKWTVVLVHKMKTNDPTDPLLQPGDKTVVAFAVWEGSSLNVGARKNYAPWVPLVLEK